MARIIVTAPQMPEALDRLSDHDVVGGDHFMDRAELESLIGDADALLTSLSDPLDAEMLARANRLKVIGQCAAGFNNIDLDAATARGIVVTTTPGVLHEATADLAFGLMLMVTRRLGEAERLVRAGTPWRYDHTFMLGAGLQGATLGIVGLGQIGEAMARRGAAFGMDVVYDARHDHDVSAIDAVNPHTAATRRVDLQELLAVSDVVSLHCPLTPRTAHLIDADALATMKDSAFLINTARGGCVDEAALAHALQTGQIAGAGLDVYEHEPTITPALLEMDNVVALPHIGSATRQTRGVMSALAARNILEVLAGRPAETPVN
ncbi:2-hydroxyacid dehydrogenase [Acidipropionibacterium jensenii]|nr:D-glycerate dehydrogenase [Acidipropionibacterium jensenii]